MNKEEFISLLEEASESDENSLSEETLLEELESWDSLAIVSFIALVDEHLEVTLSPDKLANAKTVQDLIVMVGAKITA
jgi:acyl carrier protein